MKCSTMTPVDILVQLRKRCPLEGAFHGLGGREFCQSYNKWRGRFVFVHKSVLAGSDVNLRTKWVNQGKLYPY